MLNGLSYVLINGDSFMGGNETPFQEPGKAAERGKVASLWTRAGREAGLRRGKAPVGGYRENSQTVEIRVMLNQGLLSNNSKDKT